MTISPLQNPQLGTSVLSSFIYPLSFVLFPHSAIRIPCLREAASAKAGEIRNIIYGVNISRDAPLSVPNQILFLSSAAQNTALLNNPSETVNDSHCLVGRS